jgi:polysaccharide biosynthesis/export protein
MIRRTFTVKTLVILALLVAPVCLSQITPIPSPITLPSDGFSSSRASDTPSSIGGSDYRIGPNDLVDVTVFEIPELTTSTRVTASGLISLQYIGVIEVMGKTTREVELLVEKALITKHVKAPHVNVFVREYASQPVSVLGAVKVPGIYQLKGQKYLMDMLASAQGLSETAGKTIQIIRRTTKPGLSQGESGVEVTSETIIINVEDLMQNGNAQLNIAIQANDVINVLNAGSIFVVGELLRPGEFPLRYGKDVTTTQAVALGGGTTKDAKKKAAIIFRPHADGTKEEIPIDLAKIFERSASDVKLMPNDVLFVPSNKIKSGLTRALDSVVAIAIGRAIYSR